ncbi:Uncharacterised protein [Serratia fonticola]|uniref:Uncharacterized protein n=1 Tax=Serratia fonticola TaxID=47917 RepID=A0A4V6KUS7_SERFO|nr:Uncharacterised protein [Serratia fonticola]
MGRILVFWPCLWLAMEAMTNTSTSSGATAFSAPTNNEPSRPTAAAAAGETSGHHNARYQADQYLLNQAALSDA